MIKVVGRGTIEERLAKLEQSVNFSPMIMGIAAVGGDEGSSVGSGSVTSIAGGVGITNDPEPITTTGTIDLDINSLTTETTSASGDLFAFVDVSVGTAVADQRKITRANLLGTTLEGFRSYTDAGIVVQTVAGTFVGRSLAAPAAGFTITNSGGVLGNPTFVLADDLAALEGMAGTGLVARTASNTYAQRTIVEGVGTLITDGDGISGNPTIDLDINDLTAESTSASGDLFAMVDVSVGSTVAAQRKITRAEVLGTTLETLRGITLASGIATWLATPSSANLASATSDETGSGGGGLLVFNQSPTIVTPTIASFANATHTHQNAAGGGQLDHGAALTGLTDDDHTQYALLNGRSGGQTLIGGTASGDDLILQSTSNATRGEVQVVDELRLRTGLTSTSAAVTAAQLVFALQNTGAGNFISAVAATGTLDDRGIGFINLFRNNATYSRSTNLNGGSFSALSVLVNDPTLQSNGLAITSGTATALADQPSLSVTGGGTIAGMVVNTITSTLTVGTSCTVATRRGMLFSNASVTGALTTQIGIDIAALTSATTNIGIRNAAPTVWTPSTAQVIDAAADTIAANATVVLASNTTAGAITLTSTPTIADGQNGQLLTVINTGTQDITLRDQSAIASNLRLPSASNLTLGPNDAVTFVYSSAVGDWVCVGTSNN